MNDSLPPTPDSPDIPHIAVVYGDGVGPEVMDATLFILKEAKVKIVVETVDVGGLNYEHGIEGGVLPSVFKKLERTRAMLKAPTLTPEPDGDKTFESVTDMLFSTLQLFTCEKLSVNHLPLNCVAHVGKDYAVFEPAHDPLPELAGSDKADPSAMLHAAIAMLIYLGQSEKAEHIYKAWHQTLSDGIHTATMGGDFTTEPVGMQVFAEAVAERLQGAEAMKSTVTA